MTEVSNDDRISAALLRLEQAERLVVEARKIFSYAEKQEEPTPPQVWGTEPSRDGLYPGQKADPEALIKYEDEETDECIE